MATTKKLRTRAQAAPAAPQTRDDVAADIKKLGDLMREKERIQADMNDKIAHLQQQAADIVGTIDDEIAALQDGVQLWCEANRDVLTDGGKVKFADLVTGKVLWRNNPPKVSVRGVDAVIALLEQNEDLARFVRIKKEVNKDAVLNEPNVFANNAVPGLSIVQGKEFFVIEPYNQELPE